MKTIHIKGSCEHCGFEHEGNILETEYETRCPKCHELTANFDDAKSVEAIDKEEKIVTKGYSSNL